MEAVPWIVTIIFLSATLYGNVSSQFGFPFGNYQGLRRGQKSGFFLPQYQNMLFGRQNYKPPVMLQQGEQAFANAFDDDDSLSDEYLTPASFPTDIPTQGPQCQPSVVCEESRYRTYDGSCNNQKNPLWGSAFTPYGRLVAAKYGDGISSPRLSVTNKPLPEERILSRTFFPDVTVLDQDYSLILMQWGQVVAHDMSSAAGTGIAPTAPACCTRSGLPAFNNVANSQPCYPILVSITDPVSLTYGQRCMDFVRTTSDKQTGCPMGRAAEKISSVTHWLDGSLVYGSSEDKAMNLRSGIGGQLLTEVKNGRVYPPTHTNASNTECLQPPPQQACFFAGDPRVNQNPEMALLQVYLLREHNRLASNFESINPHWTDEQLYQEARRVLVAQLQHITYTEYLPILLGRDNMIQSGLLYRSQGAYVNDYNENVDPSVLNEVAHAAFRYFHTNIAPFLQLRNEYRITDGSLPLSPQMLRPNAVEDPKTMDGLIRGLTSQPQWNTDLYHTKQITQDLFRYMEWPKSGIDLKATDMHRGRDHGLGTYNDYRHFCGFNKAQRFEDFTDLIPLELVLRLRTLYEYPDDVDLGVGGGLERHVEGTNVGPTFLCLLKEQFFRTRVSDYFFYERGNYPGAFTPDQLNEIRKSSVSRILCDNADNLATMQARAFLQVSKENPLVPCEEYTTIPALNLKAWKESPPY